MNIYREIPMFDAITLVPVASSNLAAVGYSAATSVLRIRFNSGSVYDYMGVPEHIHDGLMGAASKGSYFNAHIKNRYRYFKRA